MLKEIDYEQSRSFLINHITCVGTQELGFRISCWGLEKSSNNIPKHQHDYTEICYVVDGEGVYGEEGGQEYKVKSGSLICSRPGVKHKIRSETKLFLLYIGFELTSSDPDSQAYIDYSRLIKKNRICVHLTPNVITLQLWRKMLEETVGHSPLRNCIISNLAHSLLLSFYKVFTLETNQTLVEQSIETLPPLLRKAVLYIENNLSRKLTLCHLADHLYISSRHLTRLFVEGIGQPFSHFVQEQRIRKAIRLLRESTFKVETIASKTGFQSVHYFTRVFTEKIGVSPSVFRKKHSLINNII